MREPIGLAAAPTQYRHAGASHAAEINACHAVRLPSKPCAEGGSNHESVGAHSQKKAPLNPTRLARAHASLPFLDYEEFIGAKKHLVLGLLSQTGPPQRSNSFATG